MKSKSEKGNWSMTTRKLPSPAVLLLSFFFFFLVFAGFFASSRLSDQGISIARQRPRRLESINEGREYSLLNPGETGDDSVTSIPFQVLSWRPRAVYFPNFATPEQCRSIIEMAEPRLRPSTLALRPGDTEESIKGIRTSSGVFLSAEEDKTGILNVIEGKIARATMLPRNHGEVLVIVFIIISVSFSLSLLVSRSLVYNYDYMICIQNTAIAIFNLMDLPFLCRKGVYVYL
ncbi:hypothetical protein FH972_004097 [Carpinus fangiana]|uniref:Prolyl 4-hydroxylase alpha subunit domain-containing protein n=1 Tax=Carpinus fangiana TaxID=176857 RepID=A0A5N6QK18_9ROSI|nr:hypothetical protein FH972_004097 [Carpinus fangiana]